MKFGFPTITRLKSVLFCALQGVGLTAVLCREHYKVIELINLQKDRKDQEIFCLDSLLVGLQKPLVDRQKKSV